MKRKIAIVEDDALFREMLRDLINESLSLKCVFSADSVEMLFEWLTSVKCDLVILDNDLPGISGVDAVKLLKDKFPSVYIVMLTSFDDDESIFNAICNGANGYLHKSSSPDKLEDILNNILNGGAIMSPFIAAKALKLFTKYNKPKQDYGLTSQEKNVLTMIVDGVHRKEIADQLHISVLTLKKHFQNIYEKLQVHSQSDLVSKTIRERLI